MWCDEDSLHEFSEVCSFFETDSITYSTAVHDLTGEKVLFIAHNKSSYNQEDGILMKNTLIKYYQRDCKHICPIYKIIETGKEIIIITESPENMRLMNYIQQKGSLNDLNSRCLFKQLVKCLITFHHVYQSDYSNIKLYQIYLDSNQDIIFYPIIHHCLDGSVLPDNLTAPPEFFLNKKLTEMSDVWSLGIILYTMCASRPPFAPDRFGGFNLSEVNGELCFPITFGSGLSDIIGRMLDRNPSNRITFAGILEHPWLLANPAERRASAYPPELDMDFEAGIASSELDALCVDVTEAQADIDKGVSNVNTTLYKIRSRQSRREHSRNKTCTDVGAQTLRRHSLPSRYLRAHRNAGVDDMYF